MRIKDNFETTGELIMKKVALVLVIVSVFIMLLSVAEAAIELPLRVEVTEKEYISGRAAIYRFKREDQVPARFIAEKLGANVTWDGKEKRQCLRKEARNLFCT